MNAVVSAVVVAALVPLAILFVQLWQDMMRPHSRPLAEAELRIAAPPPAESAYPKKDGSRFTVEDNDGEEESLPPTVATTDLVPYFAGGWNLAAGQTGALPLAVPPANSASDVTPEPDAGHAPSETTLTTPPSPAETEIAGAADSNPFVDAEHAKQTERPDVAASVPLPRRKPTASARAEPTVRTVKVVTIAAPPPSRPHDGAYALGSPADAPAAWMETKTAVDMHAKAEQSSETVKVADKGVKLRVKARDKNWVQVSDPASAATGWIYNRFLQPTEPPPQ